MAKSRSKVAALRDALFHIDIIRQVETAAPVLKHGAMLVNSRTERLANMVGNGSSIIAMQLDRLLKQQRLDYILGKQ